MLYKGVFDIKLLISNSIDLVSLSSLDKLIISVSWFRLLFLFGLRVGTGFMIIDLPSEFLLHRSSISLTLDHFLFFYYKFSLERTRSYLTDSCWMFHHISRDSLLTRRSCITSFIPIETGIIF
jgi:hypothetical protein